MDWSIATWSDQLGSVGDMGRRRGLRIGTSYLSQDGKDVTLGTLLFFPLVNQSNRALEGTLA
jgi:hypothetical protein